MEGFKPTVITHPLYGSYPLSTNSLIRYNGSPQASSGSHGVYWIGADGNVWWKNGGTVKNMGKPISASNVGFDTAKASVQARRIDDPNPPKPSQQPKQTTGNVFIGSTAKVLDQEQIDALLSLIKSYDKARSDAKKKARLKREAALKEKEEEFEREKGKYEGKKLEALQDFASTKTDTDINVRDTLANLISSLSTMGLGGGRALTRQILDAANRSNRQANATQAKNNQSLDAAFNEFSALNEADRLKIRDQYDYDVAEADRQWGQNKQNALYKIADVYNAADMKDERSRYMRDATSLNKLIGDAVFLNPRYTGELRQMATPELADYTQNIARYDTSGIGGGINPVGRPQNSIGVRVLAVNDKDFGVKKKTEGELGYGV